MIQLGKIKLNTFFFCIGFIIIMLRKYGATILVLQETLLNTYIFYFLGVFLIILSAMLSQISLIDLLLFIYGVFSFFSTHDITLLSFLAIIIAAQNFDLDNIIRLYYRIQLIILGICIIAYPILKIIGSPLATTSYIAGRYRYNFFFEHPNNFAIQCVFALLAFIYINRNTFSLKKINLMLIVAALFLWIFPNSQTAAFVLLIYAITNILMHYAQLIWKPFVKFFIPILILALIYILYQFYSRNTSFISSYITGTFAARFTGAVKGLQLYDINLFGNILPNIGDLIYINGEWGTFWLDLAYVRMIITYGIVGAGIFYFLFIKSFYIFIKKRDSNVLILFVVVLLYALSEWTAFSIQTVFPLLFCSISINKKNRLIKTKYIHFN